MRSCRILPDDIIAVGNQHARQHADGTRSGVLAFLRENGIRPGAFVAGVKSATGRRE